MKRVDTYHHGNLRTALLEAARALIQEAGVEALTLRAVARRAGVTTGAPYHHFADKAALVTALARQGLEELDHLFRTTIAEINEPDQQLEALGLAYVFYAIDHPAEFRIMFRPELGAPLDLGEPMQALVFRNLIAVVDRCRAAAGIVDGQRDAAAIAAWSMVHGLAALLVDGPLAPLAVDREHVRELAMALGKRLIVV
jgi:AcrR family transcriptional regulator